MTLLEAMERRHSVRSYTDQPICGEVLASLEREVRACNTEGGLHIQLVTGEPEAFRGVLAHYGKFRNVKNYLALVGPGGPSLEERAGYYGERLVLTAAMLGLDSCWVALTFRKGKCQYVARPGEKLVCVIALGYGEGHGVPHKSKPLEALCPIGSAGAWRPPFWPPRPPTSRSSASPSPATPSARNPPAAFIPRWTWASSSTTSRSARAPLPSTGPLPAADLSLLRPAALENGIF